MQRELIKNIAYGAFIPFLTTHDLLRLSECSKALVPYRQHFSRIKLVRHPSPITPALRSALSRLLGEQQGDIVVLCLCHPSVVEALSYGGCVAALKRKGLSCHLG